MKICHHLCKTPAFTVMYNTGFPSLLVKDFIFQHRVEDVWLFHFYSSHAPRVFLYKDAPRGWKQDIIIQLYNYITLPRLVFLNDRT